MPSRILIIDDDKALHALVQAELEPEGYEVQSATNGLEGVRVATQIRPDLILLDVSMPDIDGYEVCEMLRVHECTTNTPVIFLSATADPAERARGLNSGAADFISKPFFGDELRARVRVSLRYKFLLDLEANRAMRDGMTGCWNRAYLDERLRSEMAAVARHAYPLSVAMLDIDRFKLINDTYGHPFGDKVICAVVDILNKACRNEDIVCRYGGEEFVILCPHVAAEGAMTLAERIRAGVAAHPFELSGLSIAVTCSIGVADCRHGMGADLIKASDEALYAAKRAGRNRVSLATFKSNIFDGFSDMQISPSSSPIGHPQLPKTLTA